MRLVIPYSYASPAIANNPPTSGHPPTDPKVGGRGIRGYFCAESLTETRSGYPPGLAGLLIYMIHNFTC